jgi:hypothetical protein
MDSEATLGLLYGFFSPGAGGFEEAVLFSSAILSPSYAVIPWLVFPCS